MASKELRLNGQRLPRESCVVLPFYEAESREFESLRAHHFRGKFVFNDFRRYPYNFVRPFIIAFPGNVHSIRNLAHAKNLVAVQWSFDAVRTDGFGKIEVTGKKVRGSWLFLLRNTTSDPERFRQEGSTSILLPSCGKLARERKRNLFTA
jgi:predicted ester cyclase